MAVHLRLARGGSKKRPFYRLVVADVRAPRDGAFIEKLGVYNPLLSKEDANRFTYDADRVRHWLSVGALPTESVARQLRADGLWKQEAKYTAKPKSEKLAPRAQARKDAEEKAKADAAAAKLAEAEAAKAAKEAPAAEASSEESAA
jgi:small subunit ribosomal protein S16